MKPSRPASILLVAALLLVAASVLAVEPVAVRVLAINDLHSQLLPPAEPLKLPDAATPDKPRLVRTGGVAQLATLIKRLQAQSPNHVLVGVGDLIGNSPFHARLLHEESTIAILDEMGMAASSVGNNEFGGGWKEIQRLQRGACEEGACKPGRGFEGAHFQYLAASTVEEASGKPILPPYVVQIFQNIPVAFIGLTRKDSIDRTKVYNFEGIAFRDELQTINALVPEIRAKGIEAIVVLLHEGAMSNGGPNECAGAVTGMAPLIEKIDKAVDVIVTAHTHQAYNCRFDGRVVTQASSQGRMLTSIDLQINPVTRDVISAQATNHLVETDVLPPDPAVQKLVERFEALAAAESGRIIGTLASPISSTSNAAGESPIGLIVADSMLAAVPAADLAFVNPGSLRASLASGKLTYADIFGVLPRGRRVASLSLTGAQIAELLDLQWKGRTKPFILQPSRGFSYAWRKEGLMGFVQPESIRLNGKPLAAQTSYRVVLDASLAEGSEGFSVIKAAREKRYVEGSVDYELLARYLSGLGKIAAPDELRIVLLE